MPHQGYSPPAHQPFLSHNSDHHDFHKAAHLQPISHSLALSLSLPRCSHQLFGQRNQLASGLVSKPLTFSSWHPHRSRSFLPQVLLPHCHCPGCPLTPGPLVYPAQGLPCLTHQPYQSMSLAPSVHSLTGFTRPLSPSVYRHMVRQPHPGWCGAPLKQGEGSRHLHLGRVGRAPRGADSAGQGGAPDLAFPTLWGPRSENHWPQRTVANWCPEGHGQFTEMSPQNLNSRLFFKVCLLPQVAVTIGYPRHPPSCPSCPPPTVSRSRASRTWHLWACSRD